MPRLSTRRATNVSLPAPLLREARARGINLSQAAANGIAVAVEAARREEWLAENREAMEAWNEHVEQHGIPLAEYRRF